MNTAFQPILFSTKPSVFEHEGLHPKPYLLMVNFGFKTRWLKINGKNLKGKDLAVSFLFLAFVITLVFAVVAVVGK